MHACRGRGDTGHASDARHRPSLERLKAGPTPAAELLLAALEAEGVHPCRAERRYRRPLMHVVR